MVEEGDKNNEFEMNDIFDRKMKKLTDEEVDKIEVKRETYIEGKLEERAEKEVMKKEGKTKEEIEEEMKERIRRSLKKEARKEKEKEERKKVEEKEEITGRLESKKGLSPDKFESRKGKWAKEPPLEDSAGVCMYEEKDIDLDINPDTGIFKAAYVQGVKLNL